MTIATGVAGVVVMLGAACGQTGREDPDVRLVRTAIGSYFRAIEAAEGASICSHLTKQAQRGIADLQTVSCEAAMADEARRLPDPLNAYVVADVRVEGGQATAVLKAEGTGPEDQMKLTKISGRWKVAEAPGLGQ